MTSQVCSCVRVASMAVVLIGTPCILAADPKAEIQVSVGKNEAVFRLVSPSTMKIRYPDFYLLETEVTNAQFREYLLASGHTKDDSEVLAIVKKREESRTFSTGDVPMSVEDPDTLWHDNAYPKGLDDHPVAHVTLDDANGFCCWLNERHPDVGLFRLSTWNEWMLAAYGASRKYPWGDQWDKSRVHMSYGYEYPNSPKRTEEVKARPKGRTPEGIYGMLGNVDEYIDPRDPTNKGYFNLGSRFMGGGFTDGTFSKSDDKIAPRKDYWGYSHHSTAQQSTLGFRVLVDPKKDESLPQRKRLFDQNDRSWMSE